MHVAPVPTAEAVAFVRRWHYAGTATAGVARYGWFSDDGELLGVAIFDLGNHQMRQGVFGPEHFGHVLHHQRLAVHPNVPHGTTSTFLAATLRALKKDRPDIWCVVTYADADQGHTGTIYQATNAIYTGRRTRGNLYFHKPDGTIGTMQTLKKAGTWPQRRAVAAELGWTERRSSGKHRYLFLLGTSRQRRRYPDLRWPSLPYPRRDDASTNASTSTSALPVVLAAVGPLQRREPTGLALRGGAGALTEERPIRLAVARPHGLRLGLRGRLLRLPAPRCASAGALAGVGLRRASAAARAAFSALRSAAANRRSIRSASARCFGQSPSPSTTTFRHAGLSASGTGQSPGGTAT